MIKAGVSTNQVPGVSVAAMVELTREAERLGYARCWMCDQGLDCRDVFVALAARARAKKSMQMSSNA